MTSPEFTELPKGAAYPSPDSGDVGNIITKLRYRRPDGTKMVHVMNRVPTDDELREARLVAISDGASDLEMSVLRLGWSPVLHYTPARDFPEIRRDPARQPGLFDWPE